MAQLYRWDGETEPGRPSGPGGEGVVQTSATGLTAGDTTYALYFDGVDDFAEVADTPLLSGGPGKDLSVEAWVKLTTVTGAHALITKFADRDWKDWGMTVQDGKLQVDIESGGDNWVYNGGSIPAGVWTHVAFAFDDSANVVRLYINGIEVGSGASLLKDMPDTDAPVVLGNRNYPPPEPSTGIIDEVRIWSYPRGVAEIRADMHRILAGHEPGLVAYWRLEEGSGQFSMDWSGNGHDVRLGADSGADASDPTWVLSDAPLSTEPFVRVLSPNGGEQWGVGTVQEILWTASDSIIGLRLELSLDGGIHWNDFALGIPNVGSYQWTVPAVESDNCLIRISDAEDGDPSDVSDAPFSIRVLPPLLGFTDITLSAGTGGPEEPGRTGGHGAAFCDVDGDGWPDLYLTMLFDLPMADLFFHNNGDHTFSEEGNARGISDYDGGSHGVCFADLDNDGDYDLFNGGTWTGPGVSARNDLYRNDGNGYYTNMTTSSGLPDREWPTRAVVAFDMDRDGDLDLFGVTNWQGSADPPEERNEVYRNDGNWHFTAIDSGALFTAPAGQGATDSDYDGDGDVDIIAGNFTGPLNILNNDGHGHFTLVPPSSIGILHQGDSPTTADVDNDGDLDLLLGNDPSAYLYLNNGDGTFTFKGSFTAIDGYMGGFADLDNDGDLDLVFAGDDLCYLNDGAGNFTPGPSVPVSGSDDPRAIAFADIDRDGDLDFAVACKRSRNWLVRNDYNAGHWLKVRLISPQGQAGAYGAKTRIYPPGELGGRPLGMRESRSNQGYLGQDDQTLHFGLGTYTAVDILVAFLDGTIVTRRNVAADQTITIDGAMSASADTLRVFGTDGAPGSNGNSVLVDLVNRTAVGSLQFQLSDVPDVLTLTEAKRTARSSGFLVSFDSTGGVQLSGSPGTAIAPGSGPVVELLYAVSPAANVGEVAMYLSNVVLRDTSNQTLGPVATVDGVFRVNFPVAVELVSFEASANANRVLLRWSTMTERNNYGFVVERVTGEPAFVAIALIRGAGTSSTPHTYEYSDGPLLPGTFRYRLKQVNWDGSFWYSPTRQITVVPPENFGLKQNYPNPFNAETRIVYDLVRGAHVKLAVYDLAGRVVKTLLDEERQAGTHEVRWDGRDESQHAVPSGIYVCLIEAGNDRDSRKLLVIR